ncbi:MAG: hypothetical protein FJ308_11235 [Planctomycetes bacterium]|nr:hypothetical protein [Planctomycetota bacterium]
MIANGEGWHNNHHADPRAAAHGHQWRELNISWITILAFEKMGLVLDVIRPSRIAKIEVPLIATFHDLSQFLHFLIKHAFLRYHERLFIVREFQFL